MSVKTVKPRLAAICEDITGVAKAYYASVRNLEANLPAVVISVGQATVLDQTNDTLTTEREYTLRLYVAPIENYAETEAETAVDPFYSRFLTTFSERPGLWLTTYYNTLAGVQETSWVSDSGFIGLSFGGVVYAGTEVTIRVTEIENIEQGG